LLTCHNGLCPSLINVSIYVFERERTQISEKRGKSPHKVKNISIV
jgi:hypothetical protein